MQLLGSLKSCRITYMYARIGRLAILHNERLISTLKEKDTAALVYKHVYSSLLLNYKLGNR
jgi:hypothetical protein